MTTPSGASPLVASILQGLAPDQVKAAAARGALPLPRAELLRVLVALAGDSVEQIRLAALESLDGLPAPEVQAVAGEEGTSPEILAFLLTWEKLDLDALASLSANPSTPVEALSRAARQFPPEKLDVLLQTQTRLIEAPEILDAIEANPGKSPLQGQRVQEIRKHFLAPAPAPRRPAPAPAPPEPPPSPAAPQPAPAVPEEPPAPGTAEPQDDGAPGPDRQEEAGAPQGAYERILALNVTQKIALASRGEREDRLILIRDSSRSVQVAVIGSPKLTESEVEQIAKMRNVKDEVLRRISTRRDWMKNQQIVRGLATNPKTPLPISLTLLKRLQIQDLKTMITDRNLPDTLRRMAKKTLDQRLNRG